MSFHLTHPGEPPELGDRYRCILADPPWAETGGGKIKRGADRHYPVLATPEIIRVMLTAPAWRPAADCHLWLWVTNNFLEHGLLVMRALGFRYVTNVVWAKRRFGLGQYARGQHELMLFGVRGRLPAIRKTRSLLGGDLLPRREHSRKPDEQYEAIETVSPGPRVEFFARRPRADWDVWGNEVAA